MGLRWKWVNLTSQPKLVNAEVIPPMCVAVREHFTRGEYLAPNKKSSAGNIPIPEWFIPELQRLRDQSKWFGEEDPVFAATNGRPLDEHNVAKRHLKQAAALAGLGTPEIPAVPRSKGAKAKKKVPAKSWVSWHTFRHTNSTLADAAGLTPTERQRILRHANTDMTMYYSHADLDLVRGRLNAAVDKTKLLQ